MEQLANCPICNSADINPVLEGCDFFLSREPFSISECRTCGLRFTNPRPVFSEMQKYYESTDYISHDSTQKGLLARIYKLARRFTLRKKYSIIREFSKAKTILDIGCGTGDFLNYCRNNGFSAFGVEPNEKPRKWATGHFRLDVRENLAEFLNEKIQFDCITLWHVLEHIHELQGTLSILESLLKPGGSIIIALPNINAWEARHYGKFWAALDLPRHLYHFNSSTLNFFAEKHGFRLIKTLPQTLDSFYISLLSEKYLKGKTNFIKAFFIGLHSNIKAGKPEYGHSSLIYVLEREIN